MLFYHWVWAKLSSNWIKRGWGLKSFAWFYPRKCCMRTKPKDTDWFKKKTSYGNVKFQNIYWKTIYHDIPIPQTYHMTLNNQQKYTKPILEISLEVLNI